MDVSSASVGLYAWNYTFVQPVKILITFPDQTEKFFDEKILRSFPFFDLCLTGLFKEAEEKKITLENSSPGDLDLLIALFIYHRSIYDILDENSLCDPEVYEHIEKQIQFYFLDESGEALRVFREQILFLPYHLAKRIDSLDSNKVIDTDQENKQEKSCYYVDTARKIVHEACFFRNIEAYERYLSKLRKYQKNLKANRLLVSMLEQKYNKWKQNEICLKTIKVAIRSQDAFCAKLSHKISLTLELLEPRNLRPSILWNVSQNYENPHFTKSPQLELAKRYYDIFIQSALNTLQYQKITHAQMGREDLLKFLDLFAYYNLEADFKKRGFRHREISCVFSFELNNKTPDDLQEEIRQKLHGLELPERLDLAAQKRTLPSKINRLSEEERHYTYIVENLFLSHTTEFNNEMIKELIAYWKWDEMQILENMITILPLPIGTAPENVNRLVGIIESYQTNIPFFFTLDELQPIVLDHSINPTAQDSRELIQMLIQESCEMFTENYKLAEGG